MSQQVNDTIDDYLKSLRGRVEELEGALNDANRHRDQDIISSNRATAQLHKRIDELEAELAKTRQKLGEYLMQDDPLTVKLKSENAHLRECLKRLEWIGPRMMCPICGNHSPDSSEASVPGYELYIGHASDCWLAAALKEGESGEMTNPCANCAQGV